MPILCGKQLGGQLGCILPAGHEGAHNIGPALRRRVAKPVVKPLAPRHQSTSPPLGAVAPICVGDTVELELVEDEAPNEAFWAPARTTAVDSQGAFSAKIFAPGSVWHGWIEKGYLPEAEGVEWRRTAPRVLPFNEVPARSHTTLLGRVQAAARRQQARVTGNVARPVVAPQSKAVKKPRLGKLQGRLLVKLRLNVAGPEVLAIVTPREVPRPWAAAEDASLGEVLRGLVHGTSNIMRADLWQEATLQLASATGMPARSVEAVQQRYFGLKKTQRLIDAVVVVAAGRVTLALKPRTALPVLPQRRHAGSAAQQVHQLRSELGASKRALSQAQAEIKELRANVEVDYDAITLTLILTRSLTLTRVQAVTRTPIPTYPAAARREC